MNPCIKKGRRDQRGTAVVVVIALLAIILVFISGNLRTLHLLRRDLRLIETEQTNRLATLGPVTNNAPLTSGLPHQ